MVCVAWRKQLTMVTNFCLADIARSTTKRAQCPRIIINSINSIDKDIRISGGSEGAEDKGTATGWPFHMRRRLGTPTTTAVSNDMDFDFSGRG